MRIKLVNIRVLRPIESGIARRIALFTLAVAATSVLLLPGTAKAEWPERPITVVVMYGAGGGTGTDSHVHGVGFRDCSVKEGT